MTSKQIKVSEDVYKALEKLKKKGEDFSALLKRLASLAEGQDLAELFGGWKKDQNKNKKVEPKVPPTPK